VYDPTTDQWLKKADMPTPRWYFSTSAVNGKIYALGGRSNWDVPPLATVEEYTPEGWPFAIFPWGKRAAIWGSIKSHGARLKAPVYFKENEK
jgi:hypothetical protein